MVPVPHISSGEPVSMCERFHKSGIHLPPVSSPAAGGWPSRKPLSVFYVPLKSSWLSAHPLWSETRCTSHVHGIPDYGPHPPETDNFRIPPLKNTVSAAHGDQTHSCSHKSPRLPSSRYPDRIQMDTPCILWHIAESLPVQSPVLCEWFHLPHH